jgi:Mn-dependent DtxR family transcriptional regulator
MEFEAPEDRLSMANEDYLEAMYRILQDQPGETAVRSVDVAELMVVSKASVNKAVAALKEHGLVEQHRYGRVELTPEGLDYARWVWRAHRALRKFLVHDLGVDPVVADDEACHMEHAISADTMNRWVAYLESEGLRIDD